MKQLEEDIGRREMLIVLWVFLPFLQPDGDVDEWKSCVEFEEDLSVEDRMPYNEEDLLTWESGDDLPDSQGEKDEST